LEATERIVVKNRYAEIPVGTMIVRGESICTLCDMPPAESLGSQLTKVELEDIIEEYRVWLSSSFWRSFSVNLLLQAEQEKLKKDKQALIAHLTSKGLRYDPT
jgi:hypothetical protein